jgi:16S rRNA (cytosine967-C5)-methyltransferase
MVKPGGNLVYATCSILPSENEKQIETFLERNPGWEIIEQIRMNPDQGDFDGFFGCLLRKA